MSSVENWTTIGVWLQPRHNGVQRWGEDAFEIPAAVTEGKTSIRVRLILLEDSAPWHAASYEVFVHTRPFADQHAPEQVPGTEAEGGVERVRLSWDEAHDNVGVDRYEIYAARDTDVQLTSEMLVGETEGQGFIHDDLGMSETWNYQVRAVDGSGNAGPPSEQVTATTNPVYRVEAESLLPAVHIDAFLEIVNEDQIFRLTTNWSNARQVRFGGPWAKGKHVTFEFSVPKNGTYELFGAFTKAPNYGVHTLEVDGEESGTTFDGYSSSMTRADPVSFGEFELDAGEHTLTLRMVGKNSEANSFRAGMNYFDFERKE